MRTDELIAALAADARRQPPPARALLIAGLIGTLASLPGFLLVMGVRPDIAAALATWRFDLKLAIISVALVLAIGDCARLAAPLPAPIASRASLLAPLLLVAGALVELALSPAGSWLPRLVGTNAGLCLLAIPALSIAPYAAIMLAMQSCAPVSPAAAGAAVGRFAAAIAALLYALHCFDDSPLFVATWYTLATLSVMAGGALCGRLMLRW